MGSCEIPSAIWLISLWISAAAALGKSYLDGRRRRGSDPKYPGENSRSSLGSLDGFC
jgi:hypothetical protein